MRETIKELVKGKRVLMLGFGREGQSSYSLVKEVGGYASIGIADQNPVNSEIVSEDTELIIGPEYLDCMNEFDVVFKSPGIVLPKDIREYTCEITCQADLFMKVYGRQIIGITGTKGKSTTSSLLYHVLKESGVDALFAGNIGIPVFNIIDEIKSTTTIVIELSCHQLEYAHYSPQRAIFLNLYEDHLDHYGTFEKYCDAKKNLYRNQKEGDTLFCNPEFLPEKGDCSCQIIPVRTEVLPFKTFRDVDGIMLRGNHNLLNVAFVYMAAKTCDITDEQFIKALASFRTLPHRLEFIGTKDGIEYYDDSISTTVQSAISAVKAIDNAGVILLGGMDRGIDYDPLVDYLISDENPLDYIVLMYDSGKVILEKLQSRASEKLLSKVIYREDLYLACDAAKAMCPQKKAVILSPAAASYGFFKNFEERGDCFKKHIFG